MSKNKVLNSVVVIVPVYADWESLSENIQTMLMYYKNKKNILVYYVNDNGPEANVLEDNILKELKGVCNFHYTRNKKNLGFGATCNTAIKQFSTCEDVLLLNSDTKVSEGFIEKIQQVMYAQNNIGVVCPRSNAATIYSVPIDESLHESPVKSYEIWRIIKDKLPSYYISVDVVGYCMMIRGEVVEKYKEEIFDPVYKKGYCEETDFCMRIKNDGWLSAVANHVFIIHYDSRSFTPEKKNILRSANSKIFQSRYPAWRSEIDNYVKSINEIEAPLIKRALIEHKFKNRLKSDRQIMEIFYDTNPVEKQKKNDKISVIIPSYNYGRFLEECIDSVLNQTLIPGEVILSDDASSDNTKEIIQKYKKRYPKLISTNFNNANMGIVSHFNKLVRRAKGEYICIIGADNKIPNNYIEKLYEQINKSEKIGVAYSDFVLFGEMSKRIYRNLNEIFFGKHLDNDIYYIKFPNFNLESKTMLSAGINFINGSSMFRLSAFDSAGGYQNRNEDGPEDANLFRKMIIDHGYTAVRADTFIEYRQHSHFQANADYQDDPEILSLKQSLHDQQNEIDRLNTLGVKSSTKLLVDAIKRKITKMIVSNNISWDTRRIKMRKRLRNTNFSIICWNCLGGVIYHELGQRMDTPTIDCWIDYNDFVKFVANLRDFINDGVLTKVGEKWEESLMHMGQIAELKTKTDKIIIHFNHHSDFSSAKSDWERRKRRINYENIFVLMNYDKDDLSVLDEFLELPYPHKVVLTSRKYPKKYRKIIFRSKKFIEGMNGDMPMHINPKTQMPYYYEFDFVKFLNQ